MMRLLGNDVVDLASPHARGKGFQPRFVGKVLTASERRVFESSRNPDTDLWCYWAAKESAYKALARYDQSTPSTPGQYRVEWHTSSQSNQRQGLVHTPSASLPMVCRTDEERILCLCFHISFHTVLGFGVAELPHGSHPDYSRTTDIQSRLVREAATQSLSSFLKCTPCSITIRRPAGDRGFSGPPTVWVNDVQTDIVVSLSHDGRFVFFAWCSD